MENICSRCKTIDDEGTHAHDQRPSNIKAITRILCSSFLKHTKFLYVTFLAFAACIYEPARSHDDHQEIYIIVSPILPGTLRFASWLTGESWVADDILRMLLSVPSSTSIHSLRSEFSCLDVHEYPVCLVTALSLRT